MENPKYQKCIRCNRPLHNSIAQARGYGNYCWKQHQLEIKKQQKDLFSSLKQ